MLSLHKACRHRQTIFSQKLKALYSLHLIYYNWLYSLNVGLTWKTLGALTKEARAEERVAENIPAVMMGPNPDTILITWTQDSEPFYFLQITTKLLDICLTCFSKLNIHCQDRDSLYLKIIVKSIGTASFWTPTLWEVIAKFACGITAISHELRADCLIVSTGISHNTRSWSEH